MTAALLTLAALVGLAGPDAREADPSPVRSDWQALLAADCDTTKQHVVTPVEARVLRNMPYALGGYAFRSEELTALFTADGGWYRPDPKVKKLTFTKPEQRCIDKLKALEKKLRAKMPFEKTFERKLTADHDAVRDLRFGTSMFPNGVVTADRHPSGDTVTRELGDESCTRRHEHPEGLCGVLQLICDPARCVIVAPG